MKPYPQPRYIYWPPSPGYEAELWDNADGIYHRHGDGPCPVCQKDVHHFHDAPYPEGWKPGDNGLEPLEDEEPVS